MATLSSSHQVRGIYATALSKLLLDHGIEIVDPSDVIAQRLNLERRTDDGTAVQIAGAEDHVGITLTAPNGDLQTTHHVAQVIAATLPDCIVLSDENGYRVEFPGMAHVRLDQIGATVSPTIAGHHRLKSYFHLDVDSEEQTLPSNATAPAASQILRRALADALTPGAALSVTHGKPWRHHKPIVQRGVVECFDVDTGRLVIRRRFVSPGQRYDLLTAVQEPGDYGTIELYDGGWVARRQYFRRDGTLIGTLYNIQTPTELTPAGARYVDLEIDVVEEPQSVPAVRIVDAEQRDEQVRRGYISPDLAAIARHIAETLAEQLRYRATGADLAWDVRPEERLARDQKPGGASPGLPSWG